MALFQMMAYSGASWGDNVTSPGWYEQHDKAQRAKQQIKKIPTLQNNTNINNLTTETSNQSTKIVSKSKKRRERRKKQEMMKKQELLMNTKIDENS